MRGMRRRIMSGINLNVEGIYADGRQALITRWKPQLNTKFRVLCSVKNADATTFCTFQLYSSDHPAIFAIGNGGNNKYNYLEFYNNNSYPTEYPFYSGSIFTDGDYDIILDSEGAIVNGVRHKHKRTVANTQAASLFNTVMAGRKVNIFEVKKMECWNNNILEYNFVPANKNGIYGFFDTVNKEFYRSSTGVDFLGIEK